MKPKTISVTELSRQTAKVISQARKRPIVVRSPGKPPMILRPLVDDEAADELLTQSPTFRAETRAARRRRTAGKGIALAEARRRLRA